VGYKEACDAAGCEARKYGYSKPVMPAQRRKPSFTPPAHADPDATWSKKAQKFVDACHQELLGNQSVLQWLVEKRGIRLETVKKFRLGINSNKKYFRPRESWGLPTEIKPSTGKPKKLWIPRGLVVPYIIDGHVLRIRIRRPKEDLQSDTDPRYYFIPGSSAAIMIIGRRRQAYMILETELDGMLVDQEAGDLVGVAAMGTATSKPDAGCVGDIDAADVILVSLDFDHAGAQGAWWWTESYSHKAVLWPTMCGKDPGDMHKLVDVRTWVLAGLPPVYHVGPSPLHSWSEGEAPLDSQPDEADDGHPDPPPDTQKVAAGLPATVIELGELLQKYPLRIINSGEDAGCDRDPTFKNAAAWERFRELVFMDRHCGAYLMKHPDQIIDGRNFFNV